MDSSAKRNQLLATLAEQVERLKTSDGWRAWLDAASRFHGYSLNNQLLIAHQHPTATRVAGYRTWQSLGRHVRKGEKGITILAPCTRRIQDDVTGDSRTALVGFKVVHVFDVNQTDGDELPEMGLPEVQVSDSELLGRLEAVAESLGFEVEHVADSTNGARGWWNAATRTITLVDTYELASRTRTMLHELSHALDPDCGPSWDTSTRAERELVAESAAYLVGTSLGIDMAHASTFYVASWGGDTGNLTDLATKVLGVAENLHAAMALEDAEREVA